MNNVSKTVVTQALCCACGACVGICPVHAVSMVENPGGFLEASVNSGLCVGCGKCLKVCPSVPDNQNIDNLDSFLYGNCLEGFIGYASQKRIRREGQSGGLVTALLCYLLESGKIDGAITNQFDPEKRRPKAIFAESCQALLDSCGSYYTQSAVVKTYAENKNKRLAAVVLGCQAEAIKLGCGTEKNWRRPEYLLGLVCAGQNSGSMIDGLVCSADCSKEEHLRKFRFRYSHPAYGGWPGDVMFVTDYRQYSVDKKKRLALKKLCESYRCLLCYDQMCMDADIVCGDPWGIPGNHTAGETVVIARTEKGCQLLREARDAGYIQLTPLSVEEIMRGQTVPTRHCKKIGVTYSLCREQGWAYPYSVSANVQNEWNQIPVKLKKMYFERMKFSRSRCLAKTSTEVSALVGAYRKKLERENQKEKRKQVVQFPIRCVRFLAKTWRGMK